VAGLPDVIRSLLIANRGEIAVRIARACRDLGIRAVAVHSDADRNAVHVRGADESIRLGPAEAARSYLDPDRIVEAAIAAGVEAIHPGYGFLAEDARFARAVRGAGLIFVGPSAECIARMGSKREARAIAEAAGVPVVPGYAGSDQSAERFAAATRTLGFPLLIKASAGGGGRGMRVVRGPAGLAAALEEARQEAETFFGDGALLLERLIERARHIEVQVAGDRFGSLIHLLERDCSIQRRHQKVIEEAPAACLPAAVRAGLHQAALAIARAVRYDNVGTVEFLVDPDAGEFWFLEMNTRLQVEHPVTELVTGVDLVALQLRLAAGEPLSISQEAVRQAGAAIEARVVAEEPAAGFLPTTGTVRLYREPAGPDLRVYSGVAEGSEVTPHYDGLLAKLVARGADRAAARARLLAALEAWCSAGVVTNARWLAEVLRHPEFERGPLTTDFLARTGLDRWRRPEPEAESVAIGIALVSRAREDPSAGPWSSLGSWRLGAGDGAGAAATFQVEGARPVTALVRGAAGRYRIQIADRAYHVHVPDPVGSEARVEVEGRSRAVPCRVEGERIWLHGSGGDLQGTVTAPRSVERASGDHRGFATAVVAPLPGVVASVGARVGETVASGQVVAVLEAMKLVHTLTADAPALVRAVHCRAGMTVASGQVLIELERPSQENG
jgi:acetyl/propionyl-CoA carboxylase alpha subunit